MTLDVRELVAGYTRDAPVVDRVSMTAQDGRVTVVIGPNGAGKSTLLKAVYGYLTVLQGDVRHDGRSLVGLHPKDMIREGIAYLIQGHSVFPRMSVADNLELGAWTLRDRPRAVQGALEHAFKRYPQLAEQRRKPAGVLSGGEQRMLEIARLTMTGPKTLLLDEPSVGLMPRLIESVYREINQLKSEGYTIMMVDQNVKKALEIADYVYALQLGRNDEEGPGGDFACRQEEIIKRWI